MNGLAAARLRALVDEITACRFCETVGDQRPLPHRARPVFRLAATARILIAGQAPGTRVHTSGLPFDDRSGDRLREWMGVRRDEFYDETRVAFLPMGFCFPGQDDKGSDLPPRRECAPRWRTRAMAELPSLELVLLVGQYAQRWHLGDRCGPTLSQTVASWADYGLRDGADAGHDRPMLVPLPHPSWRNTGWLKRNPWFETDLLPPLRAAVRKALDRSR